MTTRTRSLPAHKSLGTDFNLRPATEGVRADALRPGDVVIEAADHPALLTRVSAIHGHVHLRARYIWSATTEPDWRLGTFHPATLFDRALNGEY